ncbi:MULTISPECIES: hypothetical protein [unclassified Pedobacter]|uniref:hypothetical protein n=1 Tax=unclassified Pedobacter TaxID=2628915 RepID=UPI001D3011F6|nr:MULTISPECIES: hypothetical protein [unclassified Pedobacter]CAH0185976.1 hypothetical protein SRABI36_01628 [Pedobacter sp. Bi36]CAH0241760.1 hypothetical protein SRABI126_02721 [Pedobacter sp. Bi126]
MKYYILAALIAFIISGCGNPNSKEENERKDQSGYQTKGKFYSVKITTFLQTSPSQSAPKLIDSINSSEIHKEYCLLDTTNKVIITEIKDSWCKIKVIEPEWLSKTYIGWIPSDNLVEVHLTEYKVTPTVKATIKYEVINEQKLETSYKAQLIEYAIYKDTIYTKEALEDAVLEIYNLNSIKDVFETHDKATVLAVYLFTSKEAFKDKSNWIAMLIKGPNENKPRITYNDFKITALNNSADNVKTKDEIEVEKLKAYLQKRGLDLCILWEMLKKIELDNIHKADAKYPDYGDKHMALIDQLDEQSYRNLRKKYKLSDDMLSKVSIFAMSYCK